MDHQKLKGKTALVTGASQSIGFASAHHLAMDGATVVITGRGSESLVAARHELMARVPEARIEMFVGDATNKDDLESALDFAHGLSDRLDILVPTVGGANMKPLLMRDADSVRREVEVNFMSVFLMVRYGAPLLSRGGSITCISTVGVTQPAWGLGIYGSTKAAMERLVKAAALELGGAGIRVNAVRPGMTVSPEGQSSPLAEQYAAETLLGRVGEPDDIAQVVRFLAGPESGWVTGQIFSVDGGLEQGKAPYFLDDVFGTEVMDQIKAGKTVEGVENLPSAVSSSLRKT